MACQGVSVSEQEAEKKMMNRLQELEKQLLDDDDDDAGDVASVITNSTSEWSEAVLDLIHQKPNSTSPASSSSSSSPSMASSPAAVCCNQSLLMEAATAISEGRKDAAAEILTRLSSTNSIPRGNSGQTLVDHYLFKALKSRLNPTQNPPPVAELFTTEHLLSTQKLYELSQCFKLGFMAANLAILEAALEQPVSNKLHVVDFNIGQGSQYVNLLQAISVRRPGGQSVVKITAVSEDSGGEEASRAVGEVLSQHARKLGLRLRFTAVRREISELTRDSLGCEPDEALAVNFAHKLCRVPDESVSTENRRDELLRRVKGLSPKIVTLVEQELHANTAPFLTRVNEAYSYYTAVLDSIESTVPRENPDRVRAEEGLGRRLVNTVACEGRDRVERCEVFGKWRARMGMAGFEAKRPSERVAETVRGRLSSGNRVNPGFTVKEESGGVCFGWKGRTITVASAWR